MTTEDKLTSRLVEWHNNNHFEYDVYVEHHYNHYGDRGVVDLVTQEISTRDVHLFEIKSKAAIESVTGANEIIRQFNRMRRYFFRDETTPTPGTCAVLELCFLPSYECYRHIEQNADLYHSMVASDVDIGLSEVANVDRVNTMVTMRPYDEDQIKPTIMFAKNYDYRNMIDREEFTPTTLLDEWTAMQYRRDQEA